MAERKAVVAGALGVIGRHLAQYLTTLEGWQVVGLSRRKPDFETTVRYISVDLLEREDCAAKLADLTDTTHIFYAALQGALDADNVAPNRDMLVNLVETIEPIAPRLEHISLTQGGKVYGCHLGPFKTPAKETDPRHMPPDFYYDQEDFLKERQKGKNWSFSLIRPDFVCGFALGNAMNLTTVIAVYAAISKELNLPLYYPGSAKAFGRIAEVTDTHHLAKATHWAATTPACANQAFNVTNGDFFRWRYLWPRIAAFFGMEAGPPQPMLLAQQMADKGAVWDAIVKKHDLRPHGFEEIAQWPFGDFTFGAEWDFMLDMTKARTYGFHDAVDSEEMFLRMFAEMRRDKIIP